MSDLLPNLLFAAVAVVLCVGTVVVLLIRDAVVSVFACDETGDE